MKELESKINELEEMVINMDEVAVVIPWKVAKTYYKEQIICQKRNADCCSGNLEIPLPRQTFRKSPQLARGT